MPFRFNPFTDKLDLTETGALPPGGGVQTITGNTGGAVGPDLSNNINLLGSGAVTVVGNPGANTLTISVNGGGVQWVTTAPGVVINMSVNTGYIVNPTTGALTLVLPAAAVVGNILEVVLDGGTSFIITQGAGQSITFGTHITTVGVGGSIASNAQGDSLRMVCSVQNTHWTVLSSIGTLTVT